MVFVLNDEAQDSEGVTDDDVGVVTEGLSGGIVMSIFDKVSLLEIDF